MPKNDNFAKKKFIDPKLIILVHLEYKVNYIGMLPKMSWNIIFFLLNSNPTHRKKS